MLDSLDKILVLHVKVLGYLTLSHRAKFAQEPIGNADKSEADLNG
jgi:hypothetical protein